MRKPPESVLVYHSDNKRQRAKDLVGALLAVGRPYKCFVCGLREWRGKRISLEIEHKDGDFQNDRDENIEFICPNCHSQTPTFCRRKDSLCHKDENSKGLNKMAYNRRVKHPSQEGYWRTRDKPLLRKVERPSMVILQSLIQSVPMVQIGKKYGVSDNAVRKWVSPYGLEMPTRFGRSRSKKMGA